MDKHAMWKWLILLVLVAGSLVVSTPPMDVMDEDGNVVRQGKFRLGLDLRGGTSFTVKIDDSRIREEILARAPDLTPEQVEIEVNRALSGAQERALEVLRNRVDNLGIAEPNIFAEKDNRIVIQLPGIDEAKRKEAEESIRSVAFLEFRLVHERNDELVDQLFEKGLAPEGYRITQAGTGTFYQRNGLVPDSAMDREYRERVGRFNTPGADYEFMLEKEDVDGQTVYRPAFVKRRRELSGDHIKDASVDIEMTGQNSVSLKFDSKGAKKFASVTADYAPGGPRNPNPNNFRQLAIVLDDTLYSAPIIREAIYSGDARISGRFTLLQANLLAKILRAGSLPAPVKIVEKRFVAPSLGTDSINSGLKAVLFGGVGVLLFMLVYYLACGIIADLALLLNMIILPLGMIIAAGFLGIFGGDSGGGGAIRLPVLTLPGIAGILLTIGMAVDANVLIFERIREETRTGKRLWTAITAGYDRAFVTILDANLTTLLTGIILFVFGSGPIRGFAVTLCAGIMVSMFTALVVTRLLFSVVATKMKVGSLKMLSIIGQTKIDFVGMRKVAAILSLVVIAGSWGVMVTRGVQASGRVFGVDFTGGAAVTFTFKQQPDGSKPASAEQLRAALGAAGIGEAHIQYQEEMEQGGDTFLQIKTGHEEIAGDTPAEVVKRTLEQSFPEAGFVVAAEDEVGPQIGTELKKRAVMAIIAALLGIVIYLWSRFELGFAVAAIVALAHDVLITVGLYSLCGRQLSLPVVAALLTIVGYSVNDTIVVFDRIREDLRLEKSITFKEICNLSINQTLSRTVLTSLTTLITVVMLLVFGGGAINDFALTLFIGVLVGTYSSVFVATPVVLLWHRDRKPDFAAKAA